MKFFFCLTYRKKHYLVSTTRPITNKMSEILNKIRLVDPNDSEAVKEVVTAFFHSLAKTSGFECSKWLRSLVFVINRYPRFCMTHRNTAENFIIKYLESKNYSNVIEAAKSAHSLQQVRPSQEKAATPKSCWREQMSTLCYAAHKLITALFTKSVDLYQNGDNIELNSLVNSPLTNALLNLNNVSNTTLESDKLALLSTRIRNIFVFIQAMLVEIYPVAKSIRPQVILDVIVRTLSVTSGKNIGNTHNLADVCMIKIQALRTLDALGACLGSNLLPYSALVIRLPMQTLRWSSENISEDTRKVRCAAYQSISRWLTILRSSSDGGRWHDEMTTHVLDDVITKEDAPVTVLASLAFYASGDYQRFCGTSAFHNMHQVSVSNCMRAVTEALNNDHFRTKYIYFPQTRHERSEIKTRFYQKFGMPGVLGCVDGTHIGIVKPGQNEDRYRNRKKYHSINAQIVCDSDLNILSVDASHGGADHDSFIWRHHPLKNHLEQLHLAGNETVWFLGDSGYPLRPTVLTPIVNTVPNSPERYYTDLQCSVRNTVERTIGVLKARWRCLLVDRKLHYHPSTAGFITNACVVLHNIANKARIPVDTLTEEEAAREARMQITAQPSLKNLSKKAKRKLQNTMLQQSTLSTHMASEKNKIKCSDKTDYSVAMVALECAETFLTVCGAFLKPTIHKQFHERIIRECFTLSSHDRRCLGLLRVLEAARRSCRNVPPPTQYCLALYSRLVNSGNEEVVKICLQAIQEIRLHLHCSPPSLNFALVPHKEDTKTKNTNKTVSERNRAALEALLGNKKMPENSYLDEEPEAKRSKLTNEDITEQISLSSDSEKSVIISDDSDIETTEILNVEHSRDNGEINKEQVHEINKIPDNQPIITPEQNIPLIDPTQNKPIIEPIQSIFEAKTQLPVNESNDAIDGEDITLSNEIGYDLPNTGTTKILEKMEEDNLPSTNETDDIQITCGQVVKSSQDGDKILESSPKVNGFSKSPEKELETVPEENIVPVETVTEKEGVSIDEMLADFVDEVVDHIDVEA